MYENEKGNRLKVERELENLKTMIGYAKTQIQGALNSIGMVNRLLERYCSIT